MSLSEKQRGAQIQYSREDKHTHTQKNNYKDVILPKTERRSWIANWKHHQR